MTYEQKCTAWQSAYTSHNNAFAALRAARTGTASADELSVLLEEVSAARYAYDQAERALNG